MESLSNIEIPEGVINVKEYKKMLALKQHPLLHNTIYMSSEGDTINIAALPHIVRRKIEHLSPKEQEEIMDMKTRYNGLLARITTAHALAFGKAGRYGGKRREDITPKDRLTPYEEDIVELLGRLFTVGEVVKIMSEDNGIETTADEIRSVMRRHISEIEKKREEFRNKVSDVRLYNKRPRLEELAWMYSMMKMRYLSVNSIEAYNAMLRTIEQIRKEAEGDILTISGALDVSVEATIQEHIQKEMLKTVNIKEIILGRVAARMNYDPTKLIAGLHNSYYAKFVEISGDYDENAEMQYPSASTYDFAAIEQHAEEKAMDMSPEEIPQEDRSTVMNVKELFLAKIRKQKEEMDARQAIAQSLASEEHRADEETSTKMKRGRIGGKNDATPPSKTSAGKMRNRGRDYRTGEKKK